MRLLSFFDFSKILATFHFMLNCRANNPCQGVGWFESAWKLKIKKVCNISCVIPCISRKHLVQMGKQMTKFHRFGRLQEQNPTLNLLLKGNTLPSYFNSCFPQLSVSKYVENTQLSVSKYVELFLLILYRKLRKARTIATIEILYFRYNHIVNVINVGKV